MKRFLIASLSMILVAVLALSGCGPSASQKGSDDAGTTDSPEIDNLVITAGTAGGGWYVACARIGEILQKEIPGLKVTVIEGMALNNVKVVDKGRDADIGVVGTPMFLEALAGTGSFEGTKMENISAMMTYSVDTLQIAATSKSNIETIKDMKDKRIMPDRPGTGTEAMARAVLELNGLTYDSIEAAGGKVQHVTGEQAPEMIRNGHLDALFVKGQIPFSTLLDLQTNVPIRMVPLDDETVTEFMESRPGYVLTSIPAGTYTNQTETVQALGHSSVLFCRKDLPEDLVQKICAAIFRHSDEINKGIAGMEFSADKSKSMVGLKDEHMHPGALKVLE